MCTRYWLRGRGKTTIEKNRVCFSVTFLFGNRKTETFRSVFGQEKPKTNDRRKLFLVSVNITAIIEYIPCNDTQKFKICTKIYFGNSTTLRFIAEMIILCWKLEQRTRVNQHPCGINELVYRPSPPTSAAPSGMLLLPAPAKRLSLLACLGCLAPTRSSTPAASSGVDT